MTITQPLTITLTLPFPPSELRPNARVYPAHRRNVAGEYAAYVWLSLHEQLGPPRPSAQEPMFQRARMDLTAVYPDGRWHLDADGLVSAFKRGQDVIRDYRLVKDDKPAYLTLGSVETEIDRTLRARVLRVRLTEVG